MVDQLRDFDGSVTRLNEFEAVCVRPLHQTPSGPVPGALCAWMMQVDAVVRANNAKARD